MSALFDLQYKTSNTDFGNRKISNGNAGLKPCIFAFFTLFVVCVLSGDPFSHSLANISKSLLARIFDGKCILFLGAEATVSSGGASGSQLGDYIYASLGDVGIKFNNDLAIYTQHLINKGYRDEVEHCVRERFSGLTPSNKFCKLAQIPWKAIYTTNDDDLIEQSYKKQKFYNCVVIPSQSEFTSYGHADVPLYKINGNINDPMWALIHES